MNAVRQFVQTRDITPATVQMIDNYSQYIWETQKGWTNADAMAYMPQHMKLELLSYLTRTVFLQMPLIQGTGNGFLDRLTLNLDLQTYSPGDVLAREKEPMDKCIIILQGDVSEIDEQGTIGQVFGPGEVIGEGVLQEVLPCKSSLVAVSFLNVAVLHKRVFESIVVQFPKVIIACRKLDSITPNDANSHYYPILKSSLH
jgi:voltage-gated potassium channel